jgi:hypothetical protein
MLISARIDSTSICMSAQLTLLSMIGRNPAVVGKWVERTFLYAFLLYFSMLSSDVFVFDMEIDSLASYSFL